MKNSKGISLIALIITIIVIIILAAIVIGGVFNTPNDAKFANFCQEYDRVQTAVQLKYYELYQRYAIDATLTEIPTHYEIYNEVAVGKANYDASLADGAKDNQDKLLTNHHENNDSDGWVEFTNWAGVCTQPTGLNYKWYLRLNDGKMAYGGFEKEEAVMYYTPNVKCDASAITGKPRVQLKLSDSTSPNSALVLDTNTAATLDPTNGLSKGN